MTTEEFESRLQAIVSEHEKIVFLNEVASLVTEKEPFRAKEILESVFHLLDSLQNSDFRKKETAKAWRILGNVHFQLNQPQEAIPLYKKAAPILKELNELDLLNSLLKGLGNAYWGIGDYINALKVHVERSLLSESLNDELGIATSYHNIGNVYYQLSSYDKALEHYQKSLTIKERLNNKKAISLSLNNIGNVFFAIKDYEKALFYYEKSLAIKYETNDSYGAIANTMNNIGNVLYKKLLYEKALMKYEEGYELIKFTSELYPKSNLLSNISLTLNELGRFDEALTKQFECLDIRESIQNKQLVTLSLNAIGITYTKLARYDDAEEVLTKALLLAEEHNFKKDKSEILGSFADLYKMKGEFEKAFSFFEQFYKVERELFDEDQAKTLYNFQVIYETEQIKRESELEKERNSVLQEALQEAERQRKFAIEADEVKTHLLSMAAHDLKSPLQSIVGFSAIILETNSSEIENIYECAKHIESASERMLNLINDVLKSSEVELGEIKLNLKMTRVDSILKQAVLENEYNAKKKSQKLIIDRSEEVSSLVDKNRIREVFENLINNAIKYTPQEKSIRVSIYTPTIENSHFRRASDLIGDFQDVIRIEIHDEGQGLSENDLKKIFGRFQRLSSKPTNNEGSTGLGLYIVKKIVELHRGKVWASSDGKNKGASFYVELPKFKFDISNELQ